jgi:CRP/FNR family transcriptional regulator, cyclic AMP receptor protein
MEDLDFVTAPEKKTVYDRDIARAFFQSCGTPLTATKGTALFAEQTSGDKMYYLAGGEITVSVGGKTIDVIRDGEIIGEMSAISGAPRTATALARTDCVLIGLAREQFFETLQKQPEFALMLMRMMLSRIRLAVSMLRVRGGPAAESPGNAARMLDDKLLKAVAAAARQGTRTQFPKGRAIIVEGSTGTVMYVVLEGSVSVAIKGKTVETIGKGGVFGEMALVDEGPRAASANAASDCTLLAIDRAAFTELVGTNPAFGAELLKNFAERLRYLNAQRR